MTDARTQPHLFARALFAFLALPGIVAFLVPAWLVYTGPNRGRLNATAILPFLAGCGLLLSCVLAFYKAGRGTLAPWDPPRHLVVNGPYQWSRNPMYVGVALILIGWTMAFPSRTLWVYSVAVVVAFHVRVITAEEPWLARRHGVDWARYQARVRRWL